MKEKMTQAEIVTLRRLVKEDDTTPANRGELEVAHQAVQTIMKRMADVIEPNSTPPAKKGINAVPAPLINLNEAIIAAKIAVQEGAWRSRQLVIREK